MLVLTVRDGSARSITRRVDGLVCIQPFDSEEPWLAYPDGGEHHVAILSSRQEPVARLAPGDAMSVGALTVSLDRSLESTSTDPIVPLRRRPPPLALVLQDGRRHVLSARPVILGTSSTCDVVLRDSAVSRRHCEVVPRGGRWTVRDLGSTNGTYVGAARVPAAELSPGVTLVVGRTRIECVAAQHPAPSAGMIVGSSPPVGVVRAAIERFAAAPYPVLIEGESGVGKELVAREIHARSARRHGPLVAVNCGAIAPNVIESELFGHERGAFTGAVGRRRGVFEEAHGGTLFLDEIGELPLALQPKLLRVLETGEVRRVGGTGVVRVDTRIVSATLRDLGRHVAEGEFRTDLFYRLNDFRLRVPPLRERRADIPVLADHLLLRIEMETGLHRVLEDRALGMLIRHPWPGNVRELLSVLKRAAFLAEGTRIGPEHIEIAPVDPLELPSEPAGGAAPAWPSGVAPGDLAALLEWCGGNKSRAAVIAGMPRSTFRERLARERGGGQGDD